eukprot:scaffold92731_cov66-Phaeocystis_antarctica.AAC.2
MGCDVKATSHWRLVTLTGPPQQSVTAWGLAPAPSARLPSPRYLTPSSIERRMLSTAPTEPPSAHVRGEAESPQPLERPQPPPAQLWAHAPDHAPRTMPTQCDSPTLARPSPRNQPVQPSPARPPAHTSSLRPWVSIRVFARD